MARNFPIKTLNGKTIGRAPDEFHAYMFVKEWFWEQLSEQEQEDDEGFYPEIEFLDGEWKVKNV